MTERGYFAIGVHHPKNTLNIGTLWRSAMNFGAAFIFTIGHRYRHQSSDTLKTPRHVPLFQYEDFEHFNQSRPSDCLLVCVEQAATATPLGTFKHPERTLYLLGAEDNGIPTRILERAQRIVQIDTPMCLNVAVAGSIVMYDRQIKRNRALEAVA